MVSITTLHEAEASFDQTLSDGFEYGDFQFAIEPASPGFLNHCWATREQLLAAHPRFLEFLHAKLTEDPGEHFQSQWYRHCRDLFQAEARARG